jgi:quercetin dioxygenase-like cupin family protein
VLKNDTTDVTLFAFAEGQEMNSHTSGHAAVIHILSGEASIGLGEDTVKATPGTWIYMPPGLAHSLKAHTQFTMLLTLYK